MEYNRNNIEGISFREGCSRDVYKVKVLNKNRIQLSSPSYTTDWDIEQALQSFNKGTWIVINSPIPSISWWW